VETLQRCCLNSSSEKFTLLQLTDPGVVRFIADDTDYCRKIQVDIPGTYTGGKKPVAQLAINAEKLLTVLSQLDCSRVNLHIHQANKAILITTEDVPGYKGLIMPICISN